MTDESKNKPKKICAMRFIVNSQVKNIVKNIAQSIPIIKYINGIFTKNVKKSLKSLFYSNYPHNFGMELYEKMYIYHNNRCTFFIYYSKDFRKNQCVLPV